jgi:hypothetical protein
LVHYAPAEAKEHLFEELNRYEQDEIELISDNSNQIPDLIFKYGKSMLGKTTSTFSIDFLHEDNNLIPNACEHLLTEESLQKLGNPDE